MKALGDHVILRLPPKREKTEGGVIVQQIDQQRMYGRILSVGKKADEHMEGWRESGDIAAYDPNGAIALEIDTTKVSAPEVVVHYSQVLCVLNDDEAGALKIPLP